MHRIAASAPRAAVRVEAGEVPALGLAPGAGEEVRMNDVIRHGLATATPLLDWPWLERQWWFIGALLVGGLVLWEIAGQLDRDG